ncbi:MAG TPA: STAS-like domain-containing protein [Hymenobacter sp.]|jgi:hypothetical protein
MNLIKLSVARDFSPSPGPRYRWEGEESGQKFREEHLEPNFRKAEAEDGLLEVNLDGVDGYGTSFLEEAFGGLARVFGVENVTHRIRIISLEENYRDEVLEYIRDANKRGAKIAK